MTSSGQPGPYRRKLLFCHACGIPFGIESGRPDCSHEQVEPTWSRNEVGSAYEWKRLFRKRGVVVESGRQPTVLFSNGKTEQITRDRLEKATRILDMSALPSEAFRLQTVAERSERWAQAVRSWIESRGGAAALLHTDSERRLYARSAIAAGTDVSPEIGVSESELNWLTMHARAAEGSHGPAAAQALKLPSSAYPDKVAVLLRAWAYGFWEPTDQGLEIVAEIPAEWPDVMLLRAGLGLAADSSRVLSEVRSLGEIDSESMVRLQALLDQRPDDEPVLAGRAVAPEEKLWLAFAYGMRFWFEAEHLNQLKAVAPEALDDAIDRDLVGVSDALEGLPHSLIARIAPEELAVADLETLQHEWELARRDYVTGASSFDDSNSRARSYYKALAGLRSGDADAVSSLSNPDEHLVLMAKALREGDKPPELLEDRSTWPVFGDLIRPDDLNGSPQKGYLSIERAIDSLLDWRWGDAEEGAKAALKESDEEAVRDEALNIISYLHYRAARDEEAVSALEKALAGEYTANLQANAGIVAENMAPESAAFHLGRLASEAPTRDLQLAAVRRAFHVWSTHRPAWEDEETESSLPKDLREAMRSLVTSDTPIDDHREIMRLLAVFDSEWVAETENTSTSPNADTWDHKVYVARAAHDPNHYIETLAAALKAEPDQEWLLEERDGFVDGMRNLVFSDVENIGPASYAYAAIDAELPMEPFDQVALTCGAFIGICRTLSADENEPSDEVYEKYVTAKNLMANMADEQAEVLGPILEAAGNTYAMCVGISREAMLSEGAQFLDRVGSQLQGVPLRRINWNAVKDGLRPLFQLCSESLAALERAKQEATDEELLESLEVVFENFRHLSEFASNPRKAFS